MAGDPPDENEQGLSISGTVSAGRSVRVYIILGGSHYHEATRAFITEMSREINYSVLKIKRYVEEEVIEKFQPSEWFVPISIFKQNLTYKLTQYVRKIPIAFDRSVNKRKTFLRSL